MQYRWPKKATREDSLATRAGIETLIQEEVRRLGRLSAGFDAALKWGFGPLRPSLPEPQIAELTRRAFRRLSCGRLAEAAEALMEAKGVGISAASKILALMNPVDLGIYDSRAAHGLSDLKVNGRRCIPIPPRRGGGGDNLGTTSWSTAFHRYIQLLQTLRSLASEDPLARELFPRIADLEMAFFARSKYADDPLLEPLRGKKPRDRSPPSLPAGPGPSTPIEAVGNPRAQSHSTTARERALEAALFHLYRDVWPHLPLKPGEKPYYAERFRQQIVAGCKCYIGGVQAVKRAIRRETTGRERLKNHPEVTLEALVLSGEWDDLFDDDDRRIAAEKLGRRFASRLLEQPRKNPAVDGEADD